MTKICQIAAIFAGLTFFPSISYTQMKIQDSGDLVGRVNAEGVWEQKDPRWHREVGLKGHEGHNYLMRRIRLDTGEVVYAFVYSRCLDPSHNAEPHPPFSNGLRMDEPVLNNWDSSGSFFDVALNNESVCNSRAGITIFGVGEETGGIEIQWDNDCATTKVRFTVQAQEVRLLVSAKVALKTRGDAIVLHLRCYPNEYAAPCAAGASLRERHILTPKQDVAANSNSIPTIVLQKTEPWVVYYDANFDKGQTRSRPDGGGQWTGSGPCALAYDVNQAGEAAIRLTNYHIDTALSYPSTLGEMNVLLWDFGSGKGEKNNRETIAYFKSLKIR